MLYLSCELVAATK